MLAVKTEKTEYVRTCTVLETLLQKCTGTAQLRSTYSAEIKIGAVSP